MLNNRPKLKKALKFILTVLVVITGSFALASDKDTVFKIKPSQVTSVYDGDTFNITLDGCKYPVLCQNLPVRVSGVDTPEMDSKSQHERDLASKSRLSTMEFIQSSRYLELSCKRDKYFRINCSVSNGCQDLTTELIKAKLGVPYDGGTKKVNWDLY